jgi:16S rRNA (guanine527-N7)-methyltransferase
VSAEEPASRIHARFKEHGLVLQPAQLRLLDLYLGLLTKWNKTVNLTSLTLNPIADEAIDRLLIEPVVAAQFVAATSGGLLLDVGSGSGSPAIPLRIMRPDLDLVMVESRARKSAFLREAIRQVGLDRADVANVRLEQMLEEPGFHGAASWVSVRAVRADRGLWRAISTFLAPKGRVLWFRSKGAAPDSAEADYAEQLEIDAVRPLIPGQSSELGILRRRR